MGSLVEAFKAVSNEYWVFLKYKDLCPKFMVTVDLRTDKSRHTHTEMTHDTCDGERHTCPIFNTLGKCQSLIQECVWNLIHMIPCYFD